MEIRTDCGRRPYFVDRWYRMSDMCTIYVIYKVKAKVSLYIPLRQMQVWRYSSIHS